MNKLRKQGNRVYKQRILIICEGETEVNYLREIRDDLKQNLEGNSVNIQIELGQNCYGNDPSQILKYALSNKSRYDRIFCVFDKDDHKKYKSTIKQIDDLNNNNQGDAEIKAINSVPCFEYWLLLHFYKYPNPSTRPMIQSNAEKEIKKYIVSYKKGMCGLFIITKSKLDNALKNAELVRKNNKESDNPSTKMHELINDLFLLGKNLIKKRTNLLP